MAFERGLYFVHGLVVDPHLPFVKANSDDFARSVEIDCIGSVGTAVVLLSLFDHSDVPNLHYSVRITRDDFVAHEVESYIIDSVVMSEKCLYA